MAEVYETIKFADLSIPLKIVVVFAWLSIIMNIIIFITAFSMY